MKQGEKFLSTGSVFSRMRILPLVFLWLLIVVFPIYFFRSALIFDLKTEESSLKSSARKGLLAEMRQFTRDFDIEQYFEKRLGLVPFRQKQIQANPDILRNFRIPISGGDVKNLAEVIQRESGVRPYFIFLMGPEKKHCVGYARKSVRSRVSAKSHQSALMEYFRTFRLSRIVGGEHSEDSLELPTMEYFKHVWGVKLEFDFGMHEVQSRYSSAENQRCFLINIPLWPKGDINIAQVVQIGFLESDIACPSVFRKIIQNAAKSDFQREIVFTREKNFPCFVESGGQLKLYESLPGWLTNLVSVPYSDENSGGRNTPAIRVTAGEKSIHHKLYFYLTTIDLTLFAVAFIILSIFVQLSFGRTSGGFSLSTKMSLAFMVGILVPILGLCWLGTSYLSSDEKLKAEETLDFMVSELETLDNRLKVAENILSLQLELVRRGLSRLVDGDSEKIKNYIQRLIFRGVVNQFFFFRNDGWEYFESSDKANTNQERLSTLFRGPIMETLLARNGIVEQENRDKFQNFVSFSFTVLEKNFDLSFFSKIIEKPGVLVEHPLSAAFEFLVAINAGHPGKPPAGMAIPILATWQLTHHYLNEVFLERIPSRILRKGFNVYFYPYRIVSRNSHDLSLLDVYAETSLLIFNPVFNPLGLTAASRKIFMFLKPFKFFQDLRFLEKCFRFGLHNALGWVKDGKFLRFPDFLQYVACKPIAEGVSRSRTDVRVNNIDSGNPHLIASRISRKGSYFFLAYAVPTVEKNSASTIWYATGGVMLGIMLAILIGSSTSWVLTRPFSVFLEAIQSIGRGDFSWKIEYREKDEFGELALSFNQMTKALLEKEKMQRFVSEEVLKAIASDDLSRMKPGGERVEATVMFSDIRGFTSLTESHPPEEIVSMLNRYFARMEKCLKNHGAILDKFIGDAIQATFHNIPDLPSPAFRACQTALEMRAALEEFNVQREKEGKFTIRTGIGIVSGQVISGRIGSASGLLDYTVVGRIVQLAAKLEAESKASRHTGIMIDPMTIRWLHGQARFSFHTRIELESGTRSIPIYELINIREPV